MCPTLSLDELATLLGYCARTVRRQHPQWTAANGFPAPLPGMGLRWSRNAVLAWIDRPQAQLTPANDAHPFADQIAAMTRYLDARMGADA
jgi:hypothetical protein